MQVVLGRGPVTDEEARAALLESMAGFREWQYLRLGAEPTEPTKPGKGHFSIAEAALADEIRLREVLGTVATYGDFYGGCITARSSPADAIVRGETHLLLSAMSLQSKRTGQEDSRLKVTVIDLPNQQRQVLQPLLISYARQYDYMGLNQVRKLPVAGKTLAAFMARHLVRAEPKAVEMYTHTAQAMLAHDIVAARTIHGWAEGLDIDPSPQANQPLIRAVNTLGVMVDAFD